MDNVVEVKMWGTTVGYLAYTGEDNIATFEYSDILYKSAFEMSPIAMPTSQLRHTFPDISMRTFKGLPGVFADSLPDAFGNQLIDIYMAEKNIPTNQVKALDRLLYVGDRGMGALEYHPAEGLGKTEIPTALNIASLAEIAGMVASRQEEKHRELMSANNAGQAIKLIRVGSSAGGARSKALVAKSPDGKFFDGTVDHGVDFSYWLMKFDSDENHDRDGNDPKGMTRVEYIYSKLAKNLQIDIPEVSHLTLGNDFHFMIERFDRVRNNGKMDKLHCASWSGLAHAHRDETGAYSYEQLVLLARQMKLPQSDVEQIFKRAVFNIVGRNQDDHTKNFAFTADRNGEWRLSQAFDLTYSYDPLGKWTRQHQIRLGRKQDSFTRSDLIQFAEHCNITAHKANSIIENTRDEFSTFAQQATLLDVSKELKDTIVKNLRVNSLSPAKIKLTAPLHEPENKPKFTP